jgi:myosin-5
LLQLDASEMRSWLCHQKIGSTREVFFKPMIVDEAVGARDALAKHIYAQLFNWIVTVMNSFLKSTETSQRCIVETFDINTFEQLCVNYANEKLQQDFNQNKLEEIVL